MLTPALVHSLDGPPFASNCTELNGRRTGDDSVAREKRFQGARCLRRKGLKQSGWMDGLDRFLAAQM